MRQHQVGRGRQGRSIQARNTADGKIEMRSAHFPRQHVEYRRSEHFEMVLHAKLEAQIVQPGHHLADAGHRENLADAHQRRRRLDQHDHGGATGDMAHERIDLAGRAKVRQHDHVGAELQCRVDFIPRAGIGAVQPHKQFGAADRSRDNREFLDPVIGEPRVLPGLTPGFAEPLEVEADAVHARAVSRYGERGIVREQRQPECVAEACHRRCLTGCRECPSRAARAASCPARRDRRVRR